MRGCAAAAAADRVEVAFDRTLVAEEAHGHALAPELLAGRWPHHLALLAVLEPAAALEGLTRPREVDLLSYRVAARQRWWRLAAQLCAHTHHMLISWQGAGGVQLGGNGELCVVVRGGCGGGHW